MGRNLPHFITKLVGDGGIVLQVFHVLVVDHE